MVGVVPGVRGYSRWEGVEESKEMNQHICNGDCGGGGGGGREW